MSLRQAAEELAAEPGRLSRLYHEHEALFAWLGVGSLVMFVGSLLALPWIVAFIPADYFAQEHAPRSRFEDAHPVIVLK